MHTVNHPDREERKQVNCFPPLRFGKLDGTLPQKDNWRKEFFMD